ncbi:prepilin-type N-terminal cleavage/methylation domain-containing protein [Patescibacteria group bacterium]|nr:prepilin-type N-terminal cleavage/methylation domain-containing protein [Patescibacteria group bacterium]
MTSNIKQYRVAAQRALPGGFTLIETLVAVLLLATAIAGPLTLASKSLTAALVAKDQIIAYYLAQDAIEYVRFARDTNRLSGATWLTGAGGTSVGINLNPCLGANGCYLDSTQNNPAVPTACTTSECLGFPMYYDSTSGKYAYTVGSKSIFTRTIKIEEINLGKEASLAVTVSWSDIGSVVHKVTAKENIFNWQP